LKTAEHKAKKQEPIQPKGLIQRGQVPKTGPRVCMMGLGYVGLTLALTLADEQIEVLGIDKNEDLLATLRSGRGHFYETGLDRLIRKHMGRNFKTAKEIPSGGFDIHIISVGTPIRADGTPNLDHVRTSIRETAQRLKPDNLVILRSTVPVGTTRTVVIPLLEEHSGLKAGRDFSIVFAPERTIEGSALKELRELPQIIGGIDDESFVKASNLFRKLTPTIINVSSLEAAEMVKIMDNTYRDIHFAIANELALICERLNLNAVELIRAANQGYNRGNIPIPSPGVGGACLSKDPYILLDVAKKVGHDSELVRLGRKINEQMPQHVVDQIKDFMVRHGKSRDAKIFVMGFAFKGYPVTSDIRNSPTLDLVKALKEISDDIHGFDQTVEGREIERLGVRPCSVEEGFKGADAVIMMLNGKIYEELDIHALLKTAQKPVLLYDGWQIFKPEDMHGVPGVEHAGVGFV
jgi:UDP-N-acetyl-D-mannosaminuronic acid dehydrogenase